MLLTFNKNDTEHVKHVKYSSYPIHFDTTTSYIITKYIQIFKLYMNQCDPACSSLVNSSQKLVFETSVKVFETLNRLAYLNWTITT